MYYGNCLTMSIIYNALADTQLSRNKAKTNVPKKITKDSLKSNIQEIDGASPHPSQPPRHKEQQETSQTQSSEGPQKRNIFMTLVTIIIVTTAMGFLIKVAMDNSHYLNQESSLNTSKDQHSSPIPKLPFKTIKLLGKSTKLHLTAIMKFGNKPAATINGEQYYLNDKVDGKKIIKMTYDEVKLVDDRGEILTLRL